MLEELIEALLVEVFHSKRCENCDVWITCDSWKPLKETNARSKNVSPMHKCANWKPIKMN